MASDDPKDADAKDTKIDREAPTPRLPTQRTVLGLVETLRLQQRVGTRPGTRCDQLRAELAELATEFERWHKVDPTAEVRIRTTNRLSRVMREVHALDDPDAVIDPRREPEDDPRRERD